MAKKKAAIRKKNRVRVGDIFTLQLSDSTAIPVGTLLHVIKRRRLQDPYGGDLPIHVLTVQHRI